MRLRRLDLTRYGKFTDKVLDFGERVAGRPDFHLVYGANEAGKSTAFDAYLSLLFGIEARSSYGFLHEYKAMLIGGCIETEGRVLDVKRTKGSTNDLRGTDGEVLSQSALGQMIGNLTRSSYRSMFSLDNVSLEDGGKAILESKGELGTMLFAASSGLSHVSKQLSAVRDMAHALYKSRSSKTKMRELLDRLADLKEQHKTIDVAASRFEDLQHAADKTRAEHEVAVAARDARDKDLHMLRRTAIALPLVHKRQRLTAELAPIADLLAPPVGWLDAIDQFATDEAAHLSGLKETDRSIARIEGDLQAINLNHKLLNAAEHIVLLGELQARYTTAALDLPKRNATLAEEQSKLASQLIALGHAPSTFAKQKDPTTLLIDVQTTARLTTLANARAALASDEFTAKQEVILAKEKLASAKSDHDISDSKTSHEDTQHHIDTLPLQSLLGRMIRENRGGNHALLLKELSSQHVHLATAEKTLRPATGEPNALALLDAPSIVSIERLVAVLKQANDLLQATAHDFDEKQAQVAVLKARTISLMAQANITDDAAMAALAQNRDKAWQAHRADIAAKTPNQTALAASANHYQATAQTERQALTSNQREGEKVGEWRAANIALAEVEAALLITGTRKHEALAARNILQQTLEDALTQCQLPATLHPDDYVLWLKQRESILALSSGITRTQEQADTLAIQLRRDRVDIVQSLTDWDMAFAQDAPLDTLLEQAQRALSLAAAANEKREGTLRALDKLQRELKAREAKQDAAHHDMMHWQEQWALALSKTWLTRKESGGADAFPSVDEVRAVLLVLNALAKTIDTTAMVMHQRDSMMLDQTTYTQSLQHVCVQADHPFDGANIPGTAAALAATLAEEREKQSLRLRKEKEVRDAKTHRQTLADDMEEFTGRRDGMLAYYAVANIVDLRHALRGAGRAAALRNEINVLETEVITALRVRDIASALALVEAADLDAIETDIQRIENEQAFANDTIQSLHHDRVIAESALATVTANDRAARLLEERRTVELEIEETGLRYLKLRIGTDAVEAALRVYRDQHRSSMMHDAALRFQRMTDGSFTDLRTQITDKGESLLGVQSNGRSLLADAMSKGTRDQLFLALRMAGYLELAKNQSALPFVADDIMETFDNTRAAATFAMLEEVSRHGQVIYLTHHEHLCDIARSVCGDGVRITQL